MTSGEMNMSVNGIYVCNSMVDIILEQHDGAE